MSSVQAHRKMDLSEWETRWTESKIGFHQSEVHNVLKANLDKVLCGRKEVRFFFPLCGKAVDMKWLADLGHTVVGVEISEKGIKEFFSEQNLRYTEEAVAGIPGAKVFKSSDGKICLYQCDLYQFSRYGALLVSLMSSDCRYLLDTLEYNPELYEGPPFFVSEEDVRSTFGGGCEIELLQEDDVFGEKYKSWGLDSMIEKVYRLVLKPQ
ncbi:hypothetical protein DNTS_028773 [Danionella cerebrum]|uniref:thiopurine S-methyltransferase n=1 Tax=Danionella cerebrum TaxID=2873325 RepID=A0A553QUT3_9TELE|nr:hypothetical protein DNTS_028773 [Danionella translucida]